MKEAWKGGKRARESSWRDKQIWKREERVRELRTGNWVETWEKGPGRWGGGVRPCGKGVSARGRQEREDGTGSCGPCWVREATEAQRLAQ